MIVRNLKVLAVAVIGTVVGTQLAMAQCANNNLASIDGLVQPTCPGSMVMPCMASGQYALVAVQTGYLYTFSTCGGTGWDTQITIYNNAGGALVEYNDDACGVQSSVIWTATFTGAVRVVLDEYPCVGYFDDCIALTISCMPPVTIPMTNNECAGAIPLPVFQACSMLNFTNAGASYSGAPNPGCGYSPTARDVWFQFTTPANGRVLIQTSRGSLVNGVMQLYSGACGALTAVQCHDNVSTTDLMPRIDRRCNPLAGNTTYYIRFWGTGATFGSFGICISSIPDGSPGADCAGGATICSNQVITNNSNWTGCTTDLNASNRGCLGGNERQGSWYFFSPQATGTIAFSLIPQVNGQVVAVDYDFAIWGPMASITCPPAGAPIRCSWAYPPVVPGFPNATAFDTGLIAGAGQNSEGAVGDGFVNPIVVNAGQVGQIYIMYVDNFSISGQSFALNWNLSTPDMLNCLVLPVELLYFRGEPGPDGVHLHWATASEHNSSHFVVERSTGSVDFDPIATVAAQGEATTLTEYQLVDPRPLPGTSYYRLRQVDLDGAEALSNIVPIHISPLDAGMELVPNPAHGSVTVQLGRSSYLATSYRIHDVRGRIIRDAGSGSDMAGTSFTVPLHGVPPGSYVLSVQGAHGEVLDSQRLVVE